MSRKKKEETPEETKERHLKHIAKISKDIDLLTPNRTEEDLAEEYQELIREEEQKYGKVTSTVPNPVPVQKMESMEQWRIALKTSYDTLKECIETNLPQLWLPIEFALSIKSIMNILGVTLPWFGIILGRASSLKTAAIEALRDTLNTFYTDIFTAKAFVSNSTAVSKDKLPDIDMLPKVKNKLFLISELSAMFTKKEEELKETIGIFTRLADGHGLQTNTGAHGSRGYRDTYFNIVAAAVDIPRTVYQLLGFLGPKLYFLRLPKKNKTEEQYLDDLYKDEYPMRFTKVREALNEYLNVFMSCPDLQYEAETKLSRIAWSIDDRETSRRIVRLALLLSHLRAVVTTFDTHGYGGTDYAYDTTQIEDPSRAITQLRNLARGHALSTGRTSITMEDIPLIIKVALSTAPIDRVNVFDLLIANKGKLSTSITEMSLNMSDQTARKTMTELKAIELVDMSRSEGSSHELEINLKDTLEWFLSEEFTTLREAFIPSDNRDELRKSKSVKEKSPPITPYGCPSCNFTDPNPSKITEHREAEHNYRVG